MLAVDGLILIFSVFLAIAGAVVVSEFMNQSLPGTGLPVGISYLPLPITGILLTVAAIEHIVVGIFNLSEEIRENAT